MAMSFNESRMLRDAYDRAQRLELRIEELEAVVLALTHRGRKSEDVQATLERIRSDAEETKRQRADCHS